MTSPLDDDILDGLFHGAALRAFLEQAAIERGWPDTEATRRRAFGLYEAELASRNRPTAEIDKTQPRALRCNVITEVPNG